MSYLLKVKLRSVEALRTDERTETPLSGCRPRSSGARTANGTSGSSATIMMMPRTPQASRQPNSLISQAVTGAMMIAERPPPFDAKPTARPRRATNHLGSASTVPGTGGATEAAHDAVDQQEEELTVRPTQAEEGTAIEQDAEEQDARSTAPDIGETSDDETPVALTRNRSESAPRMAPWTSRCRPSWRGRRPG